MTRLPAVTARQLLRALERAGFVIHRTSGSHYLLRHSGEPKRRTIVPYHAGDIKRGTLHAILKNAGLSVEDLLKLL